jgi:hypothetical protein
MIGPSDYAEFVRREYLAEFVRAGGSSVKFVVSSEDGWATALDGALRAAAASEGYAFARVDATDVRVHMIDKVFHEIATQIDWDETARNCAGTALNELGFRGGEEYELDLATLASRHDYDPAELLKDFKQKLQQLILQDFELTQEFRIAMLRLCVAQVDRTDPARADRDAVLAWLRGELRLISALKQALIFQKIARHNARDMLLSSTRWLAKTGRSGLVLELDIRRCAVAKRPLDEEGVFYSKAAALDVYEVLRQLIDATDELAFCFVCIVAAPETLVDPKRGIEGHYQALKMRIWDEVHDRMRENPLSALVRLSSRAREEDEGHVG